MNSGCAAALDKLQDFCFMAIKAANREPCTPPRSTLILTPAFVVYTELGIDPDRDFSPLCLASHRMQAPDAPTRDAVRVTARIVLRITVIVTVAGITDIITHTAVSSAEMTAAESRNTHNEY